MALSDMLCVIESLIQGERLARKFSEIIYVLGGVINQIEAFSFNIK